MLAYTIRSQICIYIPKTTLLRTIHSDSSQCEIYEKPNFRAERTLYRFFKNAQLIGSNDSMLWYFF